MTRRPNTRWTLAAAAVAAAIAIGGCGTQDDTEPIPREQVAELRRQLDSIQGRYEAGGFACRQIVEGNDTNVARVESTIDSLPDTVDAEVRDSLRESFANLFTLVSSECEEPEPQETETEPSPLPPPTVPETDTETQPQTETEPEQRKEDRGKGKGRQKDEEPGSGDGGAQVPGVGE